ncbi:MAG TPA: DUF3488 and transglutaminase-like domain-containing protein, partial [Steroidobacteraceae bacterium]|nr:DUF3488 and transglutaminase-like domain-containing protein [Steroidobacteraceae bacterium]
SDEIAFRVRFTATTPPPHERYWRGPVLHDFDGHTWRREAVGSFAPAALTPAGGAYRYVVSLEPHQHNWIFALDWPERWDLADARLTSDYMLVQPRAITRPIEVSATSYTQVQASQPLGATMRRRDTLLPPGRNVRTLELSHRLRDEHPDDMGYVRAVLDLFRQQPFYYTLKPPALADDSVDEFLFITRHGFCGHYASAFATLMRAAGIPARVVTGYYGGAFNRFADYWIVRQSNAHAWDEIWIEGRGWLRIDPTTAIAPERVERDLKDAVQSGEPVRWSEGIPWITDMRLRVDALRQLWRERILFYDQSSQNDLLALLHIPEPDGQKVAMVLAFGLVLALAWLTWQVRREQRRESKDPLARAYDRLCSKLAAVGLPRKAYEGAESFGARIARERPDLAREVSALCRRYSRLRYGESLHHRSKRASVAEMAFAARVRTFRPRRAAL